MTWGNNGAVSGAQPVSPQPTGVQPFAPGVVGQPPGQAGATLPSCYNSNYESLMAAVSRGEVSLNQVYRVSGLGGIGNANGNPTLMQAISQGVPQNGTNGIGVQAGPAGGAGYNPAVAGNGTVVSGNGGLGSAVMAASGVSATGFGGAVIADAKQMESDPTVAMANPIQYGGN
jgi:hypothetical protein